jgi:hypothetical protein
LRYCFVRVGKFNNLATISTTSYFAISPTDKIALVELLFLFHILLTRVFFFPSLNY